MERRRRGTGTIDITPSGGFRPRLPGRGARLSECESYEEAAELLDAALIQLASGAVPVGGETLASFGESWLSRRELAGIRSIRADRSRWNVHVAKAFFADWPMRAITRADVLEWVESVIHSKATKGRCHTVAPKRKISRGTARHALQVLHACCADAVDRGVIDRNPVTGIKLARSKGRTHEPWTYLVPDEQSRLCGCLEIPEHDRLAIQFALGSGLRQSEQWSLEIADVFLDSGLVVVRYSRGGATKAGKPRRVPLLPLARVALARQLERLGNPKTGIVWPSARGYRRQDRAPVHWESYLQATGIHPPHHRHDGQRVRWHDLRHTCASSLAAGWWGRIWNLHEIKEILGHSSVTVTERYAHLAEGALLQAARETGSTHELPTEGDFGDLRVAKKLNNIAVVGHEGLEPSTNGLRVRRVSESNQKLEPDLGTIVGLALEGLETVSAGGPLAWRRVTETLIKIAKMAAMVNDPRAATHKKNSSSRSQTS